MAGRPARQRNGTGPRARAGVLAVALATATSLLLAAGPAAAQTTPKVSRKGDVVTIKVPVDLLGGKGKKGADGKALHKSWEKVINDTWGEAFKDLPYKNCLKFELDLDFESRRAGAPLRDGRHSIAVSGPSRGWDNAGWDGVPETSRKPSGDGTRSFEHGRDGEIPVSAPPVLVAHEFGHLFGLGDDRNGGTAKPGREGTLMVGGAEEGGLDPNQPYDPSMIDQNLIDRIGDAILEHLKNEDKKLPKCETWTGSLSMSHNVADVCEGSADGEVRLGVVDDAVTGTVSESGSYYCRDFPEGYPPQTQSGSFEVAGTFEDDEFVFTGLTATSLGALGHGGNSTTVCFLEPPVVVGVDPPGSASAEWPTLYQGAGAGAAEGSCEMTLERDEDEPAVG